VVGVLYARVRALRHLAGKGVSLWPSLGRLFAAHVVAGGAAFVLYTVLRYAY